MKSNSLSFAKGLQPFLFCFGMFLLAMCFSVVICFSTFYVFHNSMNTTNGVAKTSHSAESAAMKNVYASVK